MNILWPPRLDSIRDKEIDRWLPRETAAKREAINTGTDKQYVRRTQKDNSKRVMTVRRSLRKNVKQAAERKVRSGQGDRGDRAPSIVH